MVWPLAGAWARLTAGWCRLDDVCRRRTDRAGAAVAWRRLEAPAWLVRTRDLIRPFGLHSIVVADQADEVR